MLVSALWPLFERHLFAAPSTDRLFNPYRDRHAALDRPEAPTLRRANLRRYLAAYPARPDVLCVAEAPGPWGCRFSGVPLVSEAQLADPGFPFGGTPTSLAEAPHREYSARIVWRVLGPYFPRCFIWNAVPLHPHRPGAPLSIRTPTAGEVRAWHGLLAGVVAAVGAAQVVAVGRKAEGALKAVGVPARYVRHPSQGGATAFAAGMQALLDAPR